jgi:hypothetical protein
MAIIDLDDLSSEDLAHLAAAKRMGEPTGLTVWCLGPSAGNSLTTPATR